MSTYFSDKSLKFLSRLARHNNKAWFTAHKHEYETHVREPFQHLLSDLQPDLRAISPEFCADPRKIGGSLFRIYRDARFSHDKSPYKPWQGANIFHVRRREVPSPSFYLHLQPGQNFIGAGIWHPESETQRKLRQFIFDNPHTWTTVTNAPALRRRFALDESEKLTRPPRGFPADFAHIEALKLRNWIFMRNVDESVMTGPRLRQILVKDLQTLAPFVDYLCAGLDLEF